MLVLQGRTAIVTGGASGIGRACVELLEQEGVRVACWDIRASEQQRKSGGVIVVGPAVEARPTHRLILGVGKFDRLALGGVTGRGDA